MRTMGGAIYKSFLDRIVVGKDSNLFPNLNRTLYHKDSEEIEKGIKSV
jgi:hypothetical protein